MPAEIPLQIYGAIINEPGGERLHALFLRKHCSYTTVNKKVSPPIKSDVHSVQSLTVKDTTWCRTYYRGYVKSVT